MMVFTRRVVWCVVAVIGAGCLAVVLAQGRSDVPDTGGSLAALTAEIRQLRVAVEESTRSQAQTQALSVYLSVQQSRIVQVATRLDAARKELDTVTAHSRQIATQLGHIESELPRVSEPMQRAALEDARQQLKAEQEQVAFQEQQARSRETELAQALQLEDSRWIDLISRLEQLIKK